MTRRFDLQTIKTFAKRFARMNRIAHHEALDVLAARLGQAHWNALTRAWEKGWRPDPATYEAAPSAAVSDKGDVMAIPVVGVGLGVVEHGSIDGHPYSLEIDFEVLMKGEGWSILVEHAPSEEPIIEIYDQSDANPIFKPGFKEKALAICHEAVNRLCARIAIDWPRRSTKPDVNGAVQHPLFKGVSNKWHCLHCDGAFTGVQIVENMWHCPSCSATPIDIFAQPFWRAA